MKEYCIVRTSHKHTALFMPMLWLLVCSCSLGIEQPAPYVNSIAADTAGLGTDGHPTLEDFWAGSAEFVVDVIDSGLPMGESDTILLADGLYRSYVHASDRSLGVVDSCGDPVEFPGCVVVFESGDSGHSFQPVRDDAGVVRCLLPCAGCPCDSKRDHIDQQQYPRLMHIVDEYHVTPNRWRMVYEFRGSVFLRTSSDGLAWSPAQQLPQTGVWQTWLMPCRAEETVGSHPYAAYEYDCLVGAPPGIAVSLEERQGEVAEQYVFVGTGQNPSSMGCYRGYLGSTTSLMRKCDHNPLFTGALTYGDLQDTSDESNAHFDFRTISSAEVVAVGERYYMLYEGVRGPGSDDAGDTQFGLGLARSTTSEIDGPWETFPDNPILLDLPGNIGLGHADIVTDDGSTILYTSLDGEVRSRLTLVWK